MWNRYSSKKTFPSSGYSHLVTQTYPTGTSWEWKVCLHVRSVLNISPFLQNCQMLSLPTLVSVHQILSCIYLHFNSFFFLFFFSANTWPDNVFDLYSRSWVYSTVFNHFVPLLLVMPSFLHIILSSFFFFFFNFPHFLIPNLFFVIYFSQLHVLYLSYFNLSLPLLFFPEKFSSASTHFFF